MKTAFLFGGSGYIGQYLITRFLELNRFEAYIIFDLIPPQYFNKLPHNVQFIAHDVRYPIPDFESKINEAESWIFNLAAIHREPGHEANEYFETIFDFIFNLIILISSTVFMEQFT